ncbi:HVA1 family protein [Paracoccus sp. S3-43]|uniref:HVA1 family protein n=1 Tax=Paracoccus sp. S3-43 TaxID=3030011 RepID=UPI003184478B
MRRTPPPIGPIVGGIGSPPPWPCRTPNAALPPPWASVLRRRPSSSLGAAAFRFSHRNCAPEPVERTIQGAMIRRNADPDNPASLIEQQDGGRVLKSHSELRRTT